MLTKIIISCVLLAGCINLVALNSKDIAVAHTPIYLNPISQEFVCGYGDSKCNINSVLVGIGVY